ncbi:hypothetical protein ACWC24_23780 [Streptomyces sp. NPDC001443]
MSDMNGLDPHDFDEDGFDDGGPDEEPGDRPGDGPADGVDDGPDCDRLEDELRRAAAVLDPVPGELYRIAMEAFALRDLDARIAELTFDSLTDAIPVRGVADPPRMLTFRTGELSVDVEVTSEGLMGQVLPPQTARIEVLSGPRTAAPLIADDLGRFICDAPPAGPFALRLRTGAEVVVTEWLRA